MKKILIAAAIATASLGVAGTASAAMPQDMYRAYVYQGQNINQVQQNIKSRIDYGVRRGDLTRREATNLRSELTQIARLEQRYRYNGLTRWERNDLTQRLGVLSQKVRFERHDRQNRGDNRGQWQNDRYDGRR